MARREDDEHSAPRRRTPARTPEDRESILISKSLRLIEQQIDDGTVSASVLTQYAKWGSTREVLEQERLRNENAVLQQKLKTMEAAVDLQNLMSEALDAFRGYEGRPVEDDNDNFLDD